MTTVRFGTATDVGRARERNEDSFFAGDAVFVVADGLGGHRAGEVASKMAVERIEQLDRSGGRFADALETAVVEANAAVYKAASDPAKAGMATTVTVIAIDGGAAHLAQVGDSRCYLLRDGTLQQVSRDHTLVQRMVDEGTLTPEMAEAHPQRSVLTRALGSEDHVDVDLDDIPLQGGDRFLLCSDGLSSVVPQPQIQQTLLRLEDPQQASAALVDQANDLGGPDNITVIVLDVLDADPAPVTENGPGGVTATQRMPAGAPEKRARAIPRRVAVWLGVLVVVIVGGLFGVKAWANRSWYVGVHGDRVAIYQGLPTGFIVSLHHLHSDTDITVASIAAYYQERLKNGIRATSLQEARQLIERIPTVQSPSGGTPSPSPSPSPGGTPSSLSPGGGTSG